MGNIECCGCSSTERGGLKEEEPGSQEYFLVPKKQSIMKTRYVGDGNNRKLVIDGNPFDQ